MLSPWRALSTSTAKSALSASIRSYEAAPTTVPASSTSQVHRVTPLSG
jgi:hypothetical protein